MVAPHTDPSLPPSHVPSGVPLKVRIETSLVTEMLEPSVTPTLLISHLGSVQALMVDALSAVALPNSSTNVMSFVVTSSSFFASRAFHSSHPLFSIAIRASVIGSAAGFDSVVFAGFDSEVFVSAGFLSGAFAGGGAFGSTIAVSEWYAPNHLSPLRTKTLAALTGLATF